MTYAIEVMAYKGIGFRQDEIQQLVAAEAARLSGVPVEELDVLPNVWQDKFSVVVVRKNGTDLVSSDEYAPRS
jgi:hypothetical protein